MDKDHPGHPGQTQLPRPWIRRDIAHHLRDLATENDRTVAEEMRCALREHLKRNGRAINGTSTTLLTDDEGGADHASSGTAARGGAACDVCQPR